MSFTTIPDAEAERILALLDKADSTTFPAEADAFLAKAQELMARWAIDEALLSERRGDPREAVVRIDRTITAPYATAKSMLLGAAARANRCRVVSVKRSGGRLLCSTFGHPTDVRNTTALYLSLSHQAVRFMLEATVPPGDTIRRFRHAFLVAYAARIGERLIEADHAAQDEAEASGVAAGRSVALVMAGREAEVERALAEAYPNARTRRISSSSAAGHHRGIAAADRSALGGPEIDRPALRVLPGG